MAVPLCGPATIYFNDQFIGTATSVVVSTEVAAKPEPTKDLRTWQAFLRDLRLTNKKIVKGRDESWC